MGLSASMWTGVSGLLSHGEKMNVVGNNIANVNTHGFKASNAFFEDFLPQNISTTAANFGQVGRGVSVAAIYGDFSQGAFETTNEATDLAIAGNGFFRVEPKNDDQAFYTRAGNFRFDADGYLVDPHGYVLQGWEVDNTNTNLLAAVGGGSETVSAIVGSGSPRDILLSEPTSDPRHTENVTMITNLDAGGGNNSQATPGVSPFFALFDRWDGTNIEQPLADTAYAYQSTIKVYDEGGSAHDMTIYFDQVSDTGNNKQYWEYIVTIDPEEDLRTFWDGSNWQSVQGTSAAGLMMSGTLTFSSSGQLEDMSAYTLTEDAATAASFKDLNSWGSTAFSPNGYPMFSANFSGQSNASWVIDSNNDKIPFTGYEHVFATEVNFGLRNTALDWTFNPNGTAADLSGANLFNPQALAGLDGAAEVESLATTSFDGASSTVFQDQDGYTYGFLQTISVDRNGVLSGRYSNGVSLDLWQVTLYNFQNETGLYREGGNLFTQTRESGEALQGPANANGLGAISSNSLEQSNVDLAREFVQMITTQRGFQANGKVITTTDTMLGEVIALKR